MNANLPLPTLFVSHGAPTFATHPGMAGKLLREHASTIAKPAAILVLSPHWMTRELRITANPNPPTIHDFGGFPAPLYQLQYPAPGAPELARLIAEDLSAKGYAIQLDPTRGLDHGAWVPLLHLWPTADVPVIQISLPDYFDAKQAFDLGVAVSQWRNKGVWIIGSGDLTHNLYELQPMENAPAAAYATEFVTWIWDALQAKDASRIRTALEQAPHAQRAHPTAEHYLPLPFALGAASELSTPRFLDGGFIHGVISMQSIVFETTQVAQSK